MLHGIKVALYDVPLFDVALFDGLLFRQPSDSGHPKQQTCHE